MKLDFMFLWELDGLTKKTFSSLLSPIINKSSRCPGMLDGYKDLTWNLIFSEHVYLEYFRLKRVMVELVTESWRIQNTQLMKQMN